jgi:hypothetical protein
MIISQQHRYLFVEIPLTASWAIRHELVEHYGGVPILHKHASYPEFVPVASGEEEDYFVFATVRHPLDEAVSRYFKLVTDHKGAFSDPAALQALQVDRSDLEKFEFIRETGAGFADYFRRYHRRPFNTIIDLSAGRLDFVIRYERLQGDFAEVLRRLDLEQVGPIPVMNRTQGRRPEWQSYYTPDLFEQAVRRFGSYMSKWGYEYPPEWGSYSPHWWDELEFRLVGMTRRFYLRHFRYSEGMAGRAARALRARLIR